MVVGALEGKLLEIERLVAVAQKEGPMGVRRVLKEIISAERSAIVKGFAELVATPAAADALRTFAADN